MGKSTIVWSRHGSTWAAVAFYAICGLLLVIWPDLAPTIANNAVAIGLCAVGAFMVISYIRMSAFDAIKGMSLSLGLVALLLGILLLINPSVLQFALPFIWGMTLLVGGFGKVQIGFDLKRIGDPKWWAVLIGAALSFALGIVAVCNPTSVMQISMQFIGIALLFEAALDAAAEIATSRIIREYRKAHMPE